MKTACAMLVAMTVSGCCCYVVDPGNRGVLVTMGEVDTRVLPEGMGSKKPFVSGVHEVSVRVHSEEMFSECFSSDLQQMKVQLRVMYRVPEASVIKVFKDYSGAPYDSLVKPRIHEALKEVTASLTAEQVVKQRDDVKARTITHARRLVGDLIIIEDVVIENIDLSNELEHAIEQKMVQEQEAAKAKFTLQKAEVEAQTAVAKAKGEAEAIRIRGQALKETPALIELQLVEKWNGVAPLYVGGGDGVRMLLPPVSK